MRRNPGEMKREGERRERNGSFRVLLNDLVLGV